MADQDDVRRTALSLPDASEDPGHFAFGVLNRGKRKGFAWVWTERIEAKKPRVPRPDVVGIRVVNESVKQTLNADARIDQSQ